MEKKIFKSVENRQHQRIKFNPGERPVLKIGKDTFEVEDISEGGIKFTTKGAPNLEKNISGTLTFPNGETINIDGNIIWQKEQFLGLSFYDLLPASMINTGQHVAFLKTDIAIPTLGQMEEPDLEGYTVQNLTKLGIASKRLKEWMTYGYIEPSIHQPGTSGAKMLFSHFDLYMVKLFEHLIDHAFSEEDASLRIRILALAEKKSGHLFYEKSFIGFSRKTDLNTVSDKIKQKMMQWLSDKTGANDAENQTDQTDQKIKTVLKDFVPVLVEEKEKTLVLPPSLLSDCKNILIVNFKRIRDDVDQAIS